MWRIRYSFITVGDIMRAFHTLSTKYGTERITLHDFELLIMILSALEWKRHNGEIVLHTDKKCKEYIDGLGISFIWDEIIVSLDEFHSLKINEDCFWAACKLYALSLEISPCVMIDLDFIVWNKIDFNLIKCDVKTIHSEDVNNAIYPEKNFFNFSNKYSFSDNFDWNIKASNTAFAYFKNEKFKNIYCREAFKFIKTVIVEKSGWDALPYMVFAEQRLLSMLALSYNYSLKWFSNIEELFSNNQQLFTHIWGEKMNFKKDKEARSDFCHMCVNKIKKEFPSEYNILMNLPWFKFV